MSSLDLVDEQRWTALRDSLSGVGSPAVPPILADVVGRYGSTTAERVAALRTLLREGRTEDAAAVLHALRGSSAMLGAVAVEQITEALEERLTRGGPAAELADAAVDQLAEVGAATARLLVARVGEP